MQQNETASKKMMTLYVLIAGQFLLFILLFCFVYFTPSSSKEQPAQLAPKVILEPQLQAGTKEKLDLSNSDPEVGGILEKVSKHILLPKGNFTVSTVQDPEALRQQNSFVFRYVKQGDKLLSHEEMLIIYDPILDKLVDVMHLPAVKN